MLGKRIRELRAKSGLSLVDVSCKSGLDMKLLEQIESGEIQTVDNSKLMAICDNLGLTLATDFINLLNMNRHPRQFKCYRVGLLQTGSNSMRLMFSRNYNEAIEFMYDKSLEVITRYSRKELSWEDLRCFALRRDCLGHFEFDSAFFLHYFIEILTEHFQTSKVIFNIRDCYSWLNCMLNYILNHRLCNSRYYSQIEIGIAKCYVENRADLIRKTPFFLDEMLSFWVTENNRILQMLPEGRSLIVRTHEISRKIEEIAQFLNISVESLDLDLALTFPKELNHDILHELSYGFLNSHFTEHCSELMTRFFPGYTLDDFLSGNYLTDIQIFQEGH